MWIIHWTQVYYTWSKRSDLFKVDFVFHRVIATVLSKPYIPLQLHWGIKECYLWVYSLSIWKEANNTVTTRQPAAITALFQKEAHFPHSSGPEKELIILSTFCFQQRDFLWLLTRSQRDICLYIMDRECMLGGVKGGGGGGIYVHTHLNLLFKDLNKKQNWIQFHRWEEPHFKSTWSEECFYRQPLFRGKQQQLGRV